MRGERSPSTVKDCSRALVYHHVTVLRPSALAAALLAALALAGPAAAQVPPPTVADGVTVSGVDLSGLTEEEATGALTALFNRRLTLGLATTRVEVGPLRLGARARIADAVAQALAAPADTALILKITVNHPKLRAWLKKRAKKFHAEPRSTRAVLRRGVPHLTKAKLGRSLVRGESRKRLLLALRAHERDLVPLAVKWRRPAITPRRHGPAVVIRRGSRRLTLYRGHAPGAMRAVATFPVATGMAAYPTPLGSFRIVTRQRNPWWYPPAADWAKGAKPIPPGPGNPLGTRWMGLNVGAVGIHGTPDAASIGYSASHGCVRMRIADAEWLFERVRVGTPVFIVRS
jgi:lipoprotein-anchoring transpeptidase ErfK/SrfK